MKIYLKYDVHVLIYFHGSQNQNWKNIASNLPLQPHLHPQFIKTVGVSCSFFFFFFGYMVDCLRPFLKIACLQLPIQVFKEWIDRLGFSFFHVFKGWV